MMNCDRLAGLPLLCGNLLMNQSLTRAEQVYATYAEGSMAKVGEAITKAMASVRT